MGELVALNWLNDVVYEGNVFFSDSTKDHLTLFVYLGPEE